MKNVKTLAILTAALGLALAAPSAFALCGGGGYAFGDGDWNGDGYPDAFFVTHTIYGADPWLSTGSWWGFGTGNPAIGLGNDNGSWQSDNGGAVPGTQPWLYPGPEPGTWFATGGTDGGNTDNCPTGLTMIMAVSDQDPAGNGYFAVAAAVPSTANPTGNLWDFAQNGVNRVEIAIPKPNITASSKLTSTTTSVTVANVLADFQGGYYPQANVPQTATQVLTGYRVYSHIVPENAAAPISRNKADWTLASSAAMGAPATFTLNCPSASDAYLAYSVVFDGATPFETAVVGPNSLKIKCGPGTVLAEPPQFKQIHKKTAPPKKLQ